MTACFVAGNYILAFRRVDLQVGLLPAGVFACRKACFLMGIWLAGRSGLLSEDWLTGCPDPCRGVGLAPCYASRGGGVQFSVCPGSFKEDGRPADGTPLAAGKGDLGAKRRFRKG